MRRKPLLEISEPPCRTLGIPSSLVEVDVDHTTVVVELLGREVDVLQSPKLADDRVGLGLSIALGHPRPCVLLSSLEELSDVHQRAASTTRGNDPDAALCRFLLWTAIRVNLLVATWDAPAVEAIGTLAEMETRAEEVLRELLDVREMVVEPDVRPLTVMVSEMLVHTSISVKDRFALAMRDYGTELGIIMTNAEAVAAVRALDARHAVLFNPGPFAGQPGSGQIAGRPWRRKPTRISRLDGQCSRRISKASSTNSTPDG